MTGSLVISVMKLTFVDNNTTFFPVNLHSIVFRPVPYNSPGLIKGFLTSTKYGNVISISKDLESFLTKFDNEVIDENCKESRTNNATLYHSLVDQRVVLAIEHLRLSIQPFDSIAQFSLYTNLFHLVKYFRLADFIKGRFKINE